MHTHFVDLAPSCTRLTAVVMVLHRVICDELFADREPHWIGLKAQQPAQIIPSVVAQG